MRLASLVVALAGPLLCARAATLTLKGIGDVAIEPNSAISLPQSAICHAIEVNLGDAAGGSRVVLTLNDDKLYTDTIRQDSHLILSASSVEAAGFFRESEQILELARLGRLPEKVAEWRIRRSNLAYTDVRHSVSGHAAPDLTLQQPAGGAFVFRNRPDKVTISGVVSGPGRIAIRVGEGQRQKPEADGKFHAEARIAGSTKAITVYAEDEDSGASRLWILPITSGR